MAVPHGPAEINGGHVVHANVLKNLASRHVRAMQGLDLQHVQAARAIEICQKTTFAGKRRCVAANEEFKNAILA